MNIKNILIFVSCVWSIACLSQIKNIDRKNDGPFLPVYVGEIMNSFNLDTGGVELDDIIMVLHVQGNYLECIIENHKDSTINIDRSCFQLKAFVELKETGYTEGSGPCDYSNHTAFQPNTGYSIYVPKRPEWRNKELRVGFKIDGRLVYSNWVRYE